MKITIEPTRDFTIPGVGLLAAGTQIEAEWPGGPSVEFHMEKRLVILTNTKGATEWREASPRCGDGLVPGPTPTQKANPASKPQTQASLFSLFLLCVLCASALNCTAATQVIVKDQGVAQITWNGTNPPGLWVRDHHTPAAIGDTNPIASPSIYPQPFGVPPLGCSPRPFVILWWSPNSFSYAIESSLNLRDWIALITISNRPSPFEIRALVTATTTNLEREFFRLRRLDNGVTQASKPAVSQVSQPASPTPTTNP